MKKLLKTGNLLGTSRFLLTSNKFSFKTQNKIPKEDENLDNLLNQMTIDHNDNYLLKQTQKDPAYTNFRLGDFVLLENKYVGQIISLREKNTILLLTTKATVKETILKSHEIIKVSGQFDTNLLQGKVVDSAGYVIHSNQEKEKGILNYLNHLLYSSKLTASLTRRYRKRNLVEDAINTGALIIDYGSPLYKGNFNLLSGKSKLGKKTFLRNIAVNFINDSRKNTTNTRHLIYLTYSRSQAVNLKKECHNENMTIFTLSENPSDSEYYYLPTIALNYANKLIESKEGLDILFCFDDISQFIFKEKSIYEGTNQPYASKNLFADLFEYSGCFEKHTFTTFLINEEKTNVEFEEDYNRYINNIVSFTDLQINFGTTIKFYKKYLPQISINYHQALHSYLHSKFITKDIERFREIMDEINSSHEKYEASLKLNVHRDPWENYLYFDSKFVIDLIFKKGYENNINYDYILLKFVLFIFENDCSSNFKLEGKQISFKLFEFLNNKFNEENFKKLIDFTKKLIQDKFNPEDEVFYDYNEFLYNLFAQFIEGLKTKDEFSMFKNDYFPI